MQIEIKIDGNCKEPKIVILTDRMTDEIKDIVKKLSETASQMLVGFCGDKFKILEQSQISHIYASAGKVYAMVPITLWYRN